MLHSTSNQKRGKSSAIVMEIVRLINCKIINFRQAALLLHWRNFDRIR